MGTRGRSSEALMEMGDAVSDNFGVDPDSHREVGCCEADTGAPFRRRGTGVEVICTRCRGSDTGEKHKDWRR